MGGYVRCKLTCTAANSGASFLALWTTTRVSSIGVAVATLFRENLSQKSRPKLFSKKDQRTRPSLPSRNLSPFRSREMRSIRREEAPAVVGYVRSKLTCTAANSGASFLALWTTTRVSSIGVAVATLFRENLSQKSRPKVCSKKDQRTRPSLPWRNLSPFRSRERRSIRREEAPAVVEYVSSKLTCTAASFGASFVALWTTTWVSSIGVAVATLFRENLSQRSRLRLF